MSYLAGYVVRVTETSINLFTSLSSETNAHLNWAEQSKSQSQHGGLHTATKATAQMRSAHHSP